MGEWEYSKSIDGNPSEREKQNMKLQKEMKALTGERSQYLVREFNDVTIRFVLNYPGVVDEQALRKAVRAVVDSVDVLHGSLVVEKGRAFWKIWEDVAEEEYFRHMITEQDPEEAACAQALECIRAEEPVKLRCTLVEDGEKSSVVVLISHLIADGGDSKYLLGKIAEAYNLVRKTGSTEGLVVKNGSRAPEQVIAGLTKQERRALSRNPMSGAKNEFPFEDKDPGRPRLIRRVIPREVMDQARIRAKQDGATANDLILAACYQAFAAVPGVDASAPICVAAMMDLRKHCPAGDSEGLTNLAGALKTSMPDGVTGSYAQTLAEIARQTRLDKEEPLSGLEGVPLLYWLMGKLPMGMLMMAARIVYGSMAVGVTNVGNVTRKAWALGELVPEGGLLGGPLKKKPGVQVSVISFDGACALCIVGQYADRDVPGLEGLLDRMVEDIRDYAQEK